MFPTFAGYQIEEKLYESDRSAVYRGRASHDRQPVVLKILQPEHATPEAIGRFRREFEITHALRGDGIIRALSLEEDSHRLAIVLEDFGGQALPQYVNGTGLNVPTFLSLAAKISDALANIHRQNLIHKDINPANIVWNREGDVVKIIDFGLATNLPHENPEICSPNVIEGTLAYISPEQTGRMNRAVDYRSDFYSLGVTFYQLLTGLLPFTAVDPLALIHAHIARQPIAPHNLTPPIPQPLSDIVMRLLAKNAEDRYQSAYGLKADLEACRYQWQTAGTLHPFALGQKDTSSRFQLSQQLYGRETEIQAILQSFDRVANADQGQGELVLVAGPAGIGKSALVQELYKPVTARRGYFAAGKFDQLHRSPYAALIAAFDGLLNQILTEEETALMVWRQALVDALGANAQVLVDVLPALALITGPPTAVPELPPAEAENRFNLTFQNFIHVLAQASHPLALFLDDWQWMDGASRQLLQNLLTGSSARHLLLMGAYRDNEMPPAHPVRLTIEKIMAAGTAVHTITLGPLAAGHINQFIADTLHTDLAAAAPLAELVQVKTGGNPFFLGEFMKSLHTDGLLTFDYSQGRWQWDLARIQAADITDNVVALMMANIQKLALKTQTVLTLAACIGSRFDLHTLALAHGHGAPDTAVTLWPAILAGLVIPLNDSYQLPEFDTAVNPTYKFAHDRIQQAAYALIPETDRQKIHWHIGQHLRQAQPDGNIFDIVNHLNLGSALFTQPENIYDLAQLNLQSAQAAREAAAFATSLDYALTGIKLLNQAAGPWQHYDLALGLYVTAVEAAAQSASFQQMEQLAHEALLQARTLLDKMPIYRNMLRAYHVQNRMAEAIAIALPLLRQLGVDLPARPTRRHLLIALVQTRLMLRGKSMEDLLNLPLMTDPGTIAAVETMTRAGTAAYFVSPELFALMVLRLLQLFLKFGNHPEATRVYAAYGLILAGYLNDIERGYTFGELGLNLVKKLNAREFYPGTVQLFSHYLAHWREHLRHSLAPTLAGYQIALETGNLEFAGNCSYTYATHLFLVGAPLDQVIKEMTEHAAMMRQTNQLKLYYVLTMFLQSAVNLHEPHDTPWQLQGRYYDQTVSEPGYREANDQPALCTYLAQKGTLLYLFGRYQEARDAFAEVQTLLHSVVATDIVAVVAMYHSLVQLALYPQAGASQQKKIRRQVAANHKMLAQWASQAPMNFQHKADLVAAEEARVLGRFAQARPLYEQAITHAHDHEFIQEEALAYELAGCFYEDRGYGRLAHHYLHHARQAYHLWGAVTKAHDLEARFPHHFAIEGHPMQRSNTLAATVSTTGVSTTAVLDLSSVIKASQALSSEIKISSLLNRLMAVVIENAGAQAGFLLLPAEGKWQIAASGGQANDLAMLPSSVLNYVTRARESVVLDDAAHEGSFTQDPIIRQRQARSVLCLPLLHHGHLTGILYLENNLAPGAFTPERLTVLNLLASQAAISLENAQLVEQLEAHGRTLAQQVAQRTAALAQVNQEAQAARTVAEQANETKSAFLSNMSRELRTPLHTIIGFTQLVRQNGQGQLPEKQVENLDKVLVSADHLLSLINTVIDIAKIETGHMDVLSVSFDPAELVRSCMATAHPLLKEGVKLHHDFGPGLIPPLYSDPAKIKQIIINLLSNAAKFTHKGQITVRMFCHETLLTIAVADTGIGISAAALPRIFEEFEQAESTTRQQYGGTGLGLPISRGLARLLGGDLTAVSTLDAGSTFTLTIPIHYRQR